MIALMWKLWPVTECVGKFQLKLEEMKILCGPRDGTLHEVGWLG